MIYNFFNYKDGKPYDTSIAKTKEWITIHTISKGYELRFTREDKES